MKIKNQINVTDFFSLAFVIEKKLNINTYVTFKVAAVKIRLTFFLNFLLVDRFAKYDKVLKLQKPQHIRPNNRLFFQPQLKEYLFLLFGYFICAKVVCLQHIFAQTFEHEQTTQQHVVLNKQQVNQV